MKRVTAKMPLHALLTVSMVFSMGSAVAAEHAIQKSGPPGAVLVLSNADIEPSIGFSSFSVLGSDIPAGTFAAAKQLLDIRWSTTYYPQTLNEKVQLCYSPPYSSQRSCEDIQPNSSGMSIFFNDQPFGHGAKVEIRHSVLGGVRPYARPAGVDSVTIRYRY